MSKVEFATVMAYVATAINQPIAKERVAVYFDLLGDLPVEVLQIASKRVILKHPWATFPSAAELRAEACDTMAGDVARMSSGEAWELAWKTVGKIDPEVKTDMAKLDALPLRVARAVRAMGLNSLCYGKEPVGVIRSQFCKIYEGIDAGEKQRSLFGSPLVAAIEERKPLPPALAGKVAQIGQDKP